MHMFPFFLFSFFSVPFSLSFSLFFHSRLPLFSFHPYLFSLTAISTEFAFVSSLFSLSLLLVPSNSRFLLVDFSDFLRIYRHPTPGVEGKDGTLRK